MTKANSTVTDDDLIDAVKELTPAGTAEVGDRVGLTRQGAAYRLKRIEDRWPNSWVWSKKIGPTRVWFHAEHIYPCSVGIPWTDDDSNPDAGKDGAMKPRRRYRVLRQQQVAQAVYRLTPAGTKEVGELVGISRQAADHRLSILYGCGNIWGKKVGPTIVWMHLRVMPDPDGRAKNDHVQRLNDRMYWRRNGPHPRDLAARPE